MILHLFLTEELKKKKRMKEKVRYLISWMGLSLLYSPLYWPSNADQSLCSTTLCVCFNFKYIILGSLLSLTSSSSAVSPLLARSIVWSNSAPRSPPTSPCTTGVTTPSIYKWKDAAITTCWPFPAFAWQINESINKCGKNGSKVIVTEWITKYCDWYLTYDFRMKPLLLSIWTWQIWVG